jgi:hypothetical protein
VDVLKIGEKIMFITSHTTGEMSVFSNDGVVKKFGMFHNA